MKYEFKNFASKVFSDELLKESIGPIVYGEYEKAIKEKEMLDIKTADIIAEAMKDWAVKNGCTHYTHWFHPLNGQTAEKHNSFIDYSDGSPIVKFSGKSLTKDEPDASSFPSGGLRATFEARGYTYWDKTSPVFIRGHVLYIPTIFISYNGDSLDTKLPLLKSIDAIDKSATSLLKLLGYDTICVKPHIGLEQEYFLVDKDIFIKRRDLFLTGKTLFGILPAKSQELEKHYCGPIPMRVNEFMEDVNSQLWDLGILAKSEHNEVAPGQFELVPVYSELNKAVDQNMIMMEILQKTALKHNLVCLLHESPFKGINGSGKHNNYSLITNNNENLFDPGKTKDANIRFFVMISALLRAVDKYAELIRLSSSDAGNDFRLGANEAPPAIVSIYLGDVIENVLKNLKVSDDINVLSLRNLPKDTSDRNRTSPIAFTGTKFEFRMLGSSLNPSFFNTVINTILASELDEIRKEISESKEKAMDKKIIEVVYKSYNEHKRIIFSGNGYSNEWIKKAQQNGLSNIATFFEAIDYYAKDNNISLFEKYKIYSSKEISARSEIMYESFVNIRKIEAKALTSIVYQNIIPSAIKELKFITSINSEYMTDSMKAKACKLMNFIESASSLSGKVQDELVNLNKYPTFKEKGYHILKDITPLSTSLREVIDKMELYTSKDNLPFPTYEELFFSIEY